MIETKLTEKQKKAIRGVASGMSFTEAGRAAGYAVSHAPQSVSKLMKRKDAQSFLSEVNHEADKPENRVILSVTNRREHLSKIATSQFSTPGEQMGAIHLLNKMDGLYVTKIQADVRHTGGVMLVPMVTGVDDWEKGVAQAQAALMENAILEAE